MDGPDVQGVTGVSRTDSKHLGESADPHLQLPDREPVLSGEEMGIPAFCVEFRVLSDATYKICTLLSTGIVDNHFDPRYGTPSQAAPSADFGGLSGLP